MLNSNMQYLDPDKKQRDSQRRVEQRLPVSNASKTDMLAGPVEYAA